MELKFDEKGLIPAIVQDHYTKEVLTLAYMNAETLALTIAEGRTVFWSRSRQEIWRKGDTSGNVQHVVSITADCDKDALVVEVVKDGPACHTGAESCFFNEVYVSPELKQFSWQGLYELIQGRRDHPQEGSYTTYLFEKGKEKILKKVGEECTEACRVRFWNSFIRNYHFIPVRYQTLNNIPWICLSKKDISKNILTGCAITIKIRKMDSYPRSGIVVCTNAWKYPGKRPVCIS